MQTNPNNVTQASIEHGKVEKANYAKHIIYFRTPFRTATKSLGTTTMTLELRRNILWNLPLNLVPVNE